MKHILAPIVLCLCLTPVWAQETPPAPEVEEGFDLMEEGAKLLLRGLMAEVEPAVTELMDMLGDIRNYHAPEMQPNGDIIIRRKTPMPAVETDL